MPLSPRWLLPTATSLIIAIAAAGSLARADRPKVIILGFDGADAELAQQWLDDGTLPNLKRLSEKGMFAPLDTANPAQSPVSWAVMETASNPGKTNIPDFVRRAYVDKGPGKGRPFATLAGVSKRMVDASAVGDYVPLKKSEKVLMWAVSGNNGLFVLGGFAALLFLVFFAIFKTALRVPRAVAMVAGALVAAIGGYLMNGALKEVPSRFPVPIGEMQGERFWNVLAQNGVRFSGLQVPAAFPAQGIEGVRLLAGLFTPDVQGGPGAWSIFTNDEWAPSRPTQTTTGGWKFKIYEDKGIYETKLEGPENFIKKDYFDVRIDQLQKYLDEPGLPEATRDQYLKQLDETKGAFEIWKLENDKSTKTRIPFVIEPDFEKRTAKITIDGQTQVVAERKWSDYYRAKFSLSKLLGVDAIPRVYLVECHRDADDNKRLRLFVPPISISPEVQPPVLPISYPREFAKELSDAIGLYDTLGWACYTNALKDEEIDERAFLEGLTHTLEWRTKQLEHELAKSDWDVLFHVESVTDRAGHMLYRFLDPQHPQYDTKTKDGAFVRDLEMEAFGRKFPLKDGVKETYKEMDRIVGSVLDRIEAGKFGPNCSLFVISDHGFDSFRYGINVNNWLEQAGYLTRIGNEVGKPVSVGQVVTGETGSALEYVDWTKSKAYSIGLGKIYLSIKGRDPLGIVEPSEVKALKQEMIARLKAFKDPRPGFENVHPFLNAYDAAEIYTGPYSEEPGDIILGFNSGYRVSWQTTLGGYEADVATVQAWGIALNPEPWTGDHCGVDPTLVRGIFFTNRKPDLAPGQLPSLLNIAPTTLTIFGVPIPTTWDGKPLTLK